MSSIFRAAGVYLLLFGGVRVKRWQLWGIGVFVGAAAIWRPVLLQVLGRSLLDVALPPLWGGVLALLIAPAYTRLAAAWGGGRLGRTASLAVCYGVLLGAMAAVGLLLAPRLARSAASLALHSGDYAADLWQLTEDLLQKLRGSRMPSDPQQQQLRKQLAQRLLGWLGNLLRQLFPHLLGMTANLFKNLLQLVLGLFFSIYLLVDGPLVSRELTALVRKYLPEEKARSLLKLCGLCRRMVSGWLTGQLLDCLILGVSCSLGMVVLGFDFPGLVGLLVGLCSLVPVVGGALGGGLAFLLLLAVQPGRAVWFLVYYVLLQQLEGRFLYPRIVGSRLGLPPLLVLLAVLCGSELGGFLGILAALPAAAVAWAAVRSE